MRHFLRAAFVESVFAPERLRAIEKIVRQKGRLTIGELARHLDSSEITTRRDLRVLEANGKVVRAHGGVLHPEFFQTEPGFKRKAVEAVETKVVLAQKIAAALPTRGQIFIDAGTTCLEVGRLMVERKELTIVTNSIPLLQLGAEVGAKVISTGGEVRPVSLALVGALALDWLQALRFEVAVIGASGIDPVEGPSTTELSEALVKQVACSRARECFLLAHASKWGEPAAVTFAAWGRFNRFVTDAKLAPAEKSRLQRAGVALQTISS